jgi:hypothetical protein
MPVTRGSNWSPKKFRRPRSRAPRSKDSWCSTCRNDRQENVGGKRRKKKGRYRKKIGRQTIEGEGETTIDFWFHSKASSKKTNMRKQTSKKDAHAHTQRTCVRTSCKKRAVTSSSAYEERPPVKASHSPFRVRKYLSTKTRGRSGAYACTYTWEMGNTKCDY